MATIKSAPLPETTAQTEAFTPPTPADSELNPMLAPDMPAKSFVSSLSSDPLSLSFRIARFVPEDAVLSGRHQVALSEFFAEANKTHEIDSSSPQWKAAKAYFDGFQIPNTIPVGEGRGASPFERRGLRE